MFFLYFLILFKRIIALPLFDWYHYRYTIATCRRLAAVQVNKDFVEIVSIFPSTEWNGACVHQYTFSLMNFSNRILINVINTSDGEVHKSNKNEEKKKSNTLVGGEGF